MESKREPVPNSDQEASIATGASEAFSPDYATARARFCSAARNAGWKLLTYPIEHTGPFGEELVVDVAISAENSTDAALVVSSGLHGVEGLFGSAVQWAWLDRFSHTPEPRVRQVLIHALNPYGFAWRRRVNEENVDLNRNFLLPGSEYAGSPDGYAVLNDFLNPPRPPSRWEPFTLKSLALLARHGKAKLQQAVAVGQYEFPQGLFFGGKRPAWQHGLFSDHLSEWIGDAQDIVHLDLHAGLGAWATCNVLVDYPLRAELEDRLRNWFGPEVMEAYAKKTVSYQAKGGMGRWMTSSLAKHNYTFAFVEFGTYGSLPILKGLRAENQAHHWGDAASVQTAKAKARLIELFCPADPQWRQSVVTKSLHLFEQTIHGLELSHKAV